MSSRDFYIADTHFGHANAIKFDDRPFDSIEEHDAALISNWNSVVTEKDHVYILGDFCFKNERPVSYYTSRLNGHLHLLRGNHDKRSEEYESCFSSVDDIKEVVDYVNQVKVRVVLCYYWMPFYSQRKIMLYGHTHKGKDYVLETEFKERMVSKGCPHYVYNVGAMFLGYFPRTLSEIMDAKRKA